MRVSNCQPDACRRNPATVTPNGLGQAHSAADGLAATGAGGRGVRPVGSAREEEGREEGGSGRGVMDGPLIETSPRTSYRSCIHHRVPPTATSCVVFLDKLLSVALLEPGGGLAATHRTTASVRLRAGGAERGRGQRRGPSSKPPGGRGGGAPEPDTDARRRGATLGLLSFRGPSPSNTKAAAQKGNADEAASHSRSNPEPGRSAFNIGPVDGGALGRGEAEGGGGRGGSAVPQKVPALDKSRRDPPQLKTKSLEENAKSLSLKEALELFRPDFISRSQGRVKMLAQRARRRRAALQGPDPDPPRSRAEGRGGQKRKCTMPDPLCDNLFKPGERSISGREMQLRSRRIYNKLPEVTKKKEEEKKRAVSQTNRLRAEVFKKKLLDQILQR